MFDQADWIVLRLTNAAHPYVYGSNTCCTLSWQARRPIDLMQAYLCIHTQGWLRESLIGIEIQDVKPHQVQDR